MLDGVLTLVRPGGVGDRAKHWCRAAERTTPAMSTRQWCTVVWSIAISTLGHGRTARRWHLHTSLAVIERAATQAAVDALDRVVLRESVYPACVPMRDSNSLALGCRPRNQAKTGAMLSPRALEQDSETGRDAVAAILFLPGI